MDRMNVLHVITDRDRRGAQVYATDLARGLAMLGCEGQVVALTTGRHGDILEVDALGPSRRSMKTLRELRRRAGNFDIVVAHGSATLLACAVALLGTGIPFVYRQISDPLYWAASWPRRLRVALLIRRASAVVALSSSTASVLARHYHLPVESLVVIPNSVPAAPFEVATRQQAVSARRSLGVPEDGTVALYIGALAQEKGVDIAISAVVADAGVSLLVVGDGPAAGQLRELAEKMAPARVFFVGSLGDPTSAYHASDMILLPSRGGDSMPAVLIEAGLCGLPAVTTPVGAITDVIQDRVTGRVVPVADQSAFSGAVAELVKDADTRLRLGRAARDHCTEHFTIEATAPSWLELLRGVSG